MESKSSASESLVELTEEEMLSLHMTQEQRDNDFSKEVKALDRILTEMRALDRILKEV